MNKKNKTIDKEHENYSFIYLISPRCKPVSIKLIIWIKIYIDILTIASVQTAGNSKILMKIMPFLERTVGI